MQLSDETKVTIAIRDMIHYYIGFLKVEKHNSVGIFTMPEKQEYVQLSMVRKKSSNKYQHKIDDSVLLLFFSNLIIVNFLFNKCRIHLKHIYQTAFTLLKFIYIKDR